MASRRLSYEIIVQKKEIQTDLRLEQVDSLALIDCMDHPFFSILQKLTEIDLSKKTNDGKVILYSINHLISQIRSDIVKGEISVFIDPDIKNTNPFGGYWISAVAIEKTEKPIVYYLRGLKIGPHQDYTGKDSIE